MGFIKKGLRPLTTVIILLLFTGNIGAITLFGVKLSVFNKKVTQLEKVNANLQAGVVGNKTSIETNAREINGVKIQLGKITARVSAVDNSSNIEGDGNVVNDTNLMKYIVYVFGAIIIWLIRMLMDRNKQISNYIKREARQEEKLNEWQNKMIERLTFKIQGEKK